MKIKILGTSNGVISGGYADALGSMNDVTIVQNLSIGSSHATIVPFALLEDDTAITADVFLLDMCVNEQRAEAKGLYNTNLSEMMLSHFCQHCAKVGAAPLALLLPNLDQNGHFNSSSVRRWRDICSRFNVDYIDVVELSGRFGLPRDLWRDGNHPTVEFSQIIAREIAEVARSVARRGLSPEARDECPISIIRCEVGAKVIRSTRLTSKPFSRLLEGDEFDLALPNGSDFEVLGASLNMAQTHAALAFTGENVVVQRYDNGYYDAKRPLWYVSWGLVSPVRSKNGTVRVRVIRPKSSASQLRNDHITGPLPESDQRRVVIELGGLVVREIRIIDSVR